MEKLISNVMENCRLRISAAISLGIHLLLIFTATFLFSGIEIRQTPIRHVKVTLYPSKDEKKSIPKFDPPASVKNQIQRPKQRESIPEKKQRKPILQKEFEPPIPFPVQVVAREVPVKELKPFFPPRKEEKIGKEPAHVAMDTALDKAFDLKKEEHLSIPVALQGNNLLDPASGGEGARVEQGGFPGGDPGNGSGAGKEGFYWRIPGEGRGLGQGSSPGGGSANGLGSSTGSREGNSPGGGSRKGAGIFSKFSSSSGGMGGGYARYAENTKPPYPEEARKKGMVGEVLLRVEVLASGCVGQIEVKRSSGHEILDRSALSTVKQWRFIPAHHGNGSISCWVNVPIKFQLQ